MTGRGLLSLDLEWQRTLGGVISEFRQMGEKQLETIAKKLAKKRTFKKKDPDIRCKNCGLTITSEKEVVNVCGKHRHVFTNPAGIVYEIGCFASAKGCFTMGEPTLEYTWFPGYAWCYANCAKCSSHLGWQFRSGEHRFFGLILERLTRSNI